MHPVAIAGRRFREGKKKRDKEVPRGMISGILFRIGDQQLVDDADENIADDKDGNPAPPLHIGRDEVGETAPDHRPDHRDRQQDHDQVIPCELHHLAGAAGLADKPSQPFRRHAQHPEYDDRGQHGKKVRGKDIDCADTRRREEQGQHVEQQRKGNPQQQVRREDRDDLRQIVPDRPAHRRQQADGKKSPGKAPAERFPGRKVFKRVKNPVHRLRID